jgi:Ca-activated chloride channel family protein
LEFTNPQWLNGLFLVPLIIFAMLYGARRRRGALLSFVGPDLSTPLAPGRSWRKSALKALLKLCGYVLLILALAGPRFGTHLVKVEREGIDLVIALDVSLSMMAEDMKPNRLERAKQEIADLVHGLSGDRVGLVAFAGDAFVLCPLTVDYNAALMFARTAGVDIVSEPGTAIDKAIRKSAAMFDETTKSDKVVILVTDGESHQGKPITAAEEADRQGVRIYSIGIGNPAGELIPLRGTDGAIEGYKKDTSGETILTRLDETTLRRVAEVSGGQYLPATREGLELQVLYREISGMEKRLISGEFQERKRARFPLFLAFAFGLLLLEAVLTTRGPAGRQRMARLIHTGAASVTAVLMLLLPDPAFAKGIDGGKVKSGNQYYDAGEYTKALYLYREALIDSLDPSDKAKGVAYNQGNALHMLKKYPEALRKYHESFSEDSVLAGRMLYNRGNTLLELGRLEDAVESYVQSLRFLPDDVDVRHNLEVALRRLEESELQNQQKDRQQENDGQEQDEQGDPSRSDRSDGEEGENDRRPDEDSSGIPPDSSRAQAPQSADSTATGEETQEPQLMELSKEDALRLLKALEEQEEALQKARRKAAFKRVVKSRKDW